MERGKPGRNDPCPCGSGRKFKKCCLARTQPVELDPSSLQRAAEALRKHTRQEVERRRRFGEVGPVVSAVHKGYRFIAVGSRLYYHKNWRTFTDFLLFYIRDVMGKAWWQAELAKENCSRHPIVQWYDHFVQLSRDQKPDEDGLLSAVPDGTMAALLLLAYDLYVLRSHAKLQEEVTERLRLADQFPGARYELFVAATFVRAGLDFEYEDETDTKRKHPEFIATFRPNGLKVAVEAKARRRIVAKTIDVATIRPGVRELLLNAAGKASDLPLVVFVELNLPPEGVQQPPSWIAEVQQVVAEISTERGGTSPFAAVFFTNRPHIYGLPGEPDPSHHVYALWPGDVGLPDELVEALGNAAGQYGNVPSRFPDDFGDQTTTGT